MQVDYFDFGVPVDVKAPPADQVTDLGGAAATSLGASLTDADTQGARMAIARSGTPPR